MNRTTRPTSILDSILSADVSRENNRTMRVALERIIDNPYQYRQHYAPAGIAQLAANISALCFQLPATSGLQSAPMGRLVRIDPVTGGVTPVVGASAETALRRDPDVRVQLAFGHRRLRAFQVLANGLATVFPGSDAGVALPEPSAEYANLPVLLAEIDDQGMAEYALTENSQREDVSAIEEATLLQRMVDEFGLSLEDAGRKFGWTRSTVSNKLRLLALPAGVRDHVLTGTLSEKHARTLLRLVAVPALLAEVAARCVKEAWATRQLDEEISKAIRQLPPVPAEACTMADQYGTPRNVAPPWDLAWTPSVGSGVRGACDGCPARVLFNGDNGHRCAFPACHKLKAKLWDAVVMERETAAARAALDAMGRQAVPIQTGGDWRTQINFRSKGAEALMLEAGACGPTCPCFVAIYRGDYYDPDQLNRPDPENAPHVAYGCTDTACFNAKAKPFQAIVSQQDREDRAAKDAEKRATDDAYRARVEKAEADDAMRMAVKAEHERQSREHAARAVAALGGLWAMWDSKAFLIEMIIRLEKGIAGYSSADSLRQVMATWPIRTLRDRVAVIVLTGNLYSGSYDPDASATICDRVIQMAQGETK